MGCGGSKTKELDQSNPKSNEKQKESVTQNKGLRDEFPKNAKKKASKSGGGGKPTGDKYTSRELEFLMGTGEDITETTPEEIQNLMDENGFTMFHKVFDQNPIDVINQYCKENNKIFRSPYYHYVDYEKECNIHLDWVRPRAINPKCEMFLGDGPQLTDTRQGGIGNCGVCAMAGAIQTLPVKPFNENLSPDYLNPYGAYTVKVFVGGKWRYSLIDDLIPVSKGTLQPWSWHTDDNCLEMWPLILEKHMSNMSGEYNPWPKNFWIRDEELPSPSMYDYGYVFNCNTHHNILQLSDDKNWKIFADYLGTDAVACQGFKKDKETQALGLVDAHGYIIIKAMAFPEKNLYFLRIRNPWGCHEWKGDWSDESPLWKKHPDLFAKMDVVNKDDGAFWMERKDCIKHGLIELPLIVLAHEKSGFTNHVVNGTLTPEMYDDENLCPAVHITIDEDCLIFFSPECIDYRYTTEDIRCFADIFYADGDRRSVDPYVSTWLLDGDLGRERPDHFYELKKGEYIMVFKPSIKFNSEREFCSRITTRPGSSIKELVNFGSFMISNKCFDTVEDLMICPFSCYGMGNTTLQIRAMFKANNFVEFTEGYNLTLGDPNPGTLKYQCVSTVSDNKQIVGIYKEGTKFKFEKGAKKGTPQNKNEEKEMRIESLYLANYGGVNVIEEISSRIVDEKLNFKLDFDIGDSPLKNVNKALIISFYFDGQARQCYWNFGEDVIIGQN